MSENDRGDMVSGRGERRSSARAQISMEYLAVVGVSLVLLIPMILIFYQQSGSLRDDINAAQLEKVGLELMDAAEEVYYLGPPTQKYLLLHLPGQVNTVTINQQEILINYTTTSSTRYYSLFTDLPLNMSGAIDAFQGQHKVSIQATDTGVNISDVS
ncbi:hypothetical protein GF367_03910 [Candidatus Woesearchaeota archaeon]|nr:hypothetical protein [Candidatus Woesearchaeota archaeon]